MTFLAQFVVPLQEMVNAIAIVTIAASLTVAIPIAASLTAATPTAVIPTAVIPTGARSAGTPMVVIPTAWEVVARRGIDRAMLHFKMIGMMTTMIGSN